ncbi:MAG: pyridine nucleotide-disulfide oxidoreductase [Clostridiales bacterium 43-6]|nr:MAG: pyridine nucleotide-disulfide oxidoreductase [Clostridiales bacterium 43-6]
MTYFNETEKQIPIVDDFDVVVAGGGPAGVGAAISAARNGARTLIIEQAGDIGGVATTGLMSHWTGNTKGPLYEEILERSRDDHRGQGNSHTINPEKLKTVFLEMLLEAGVKIKLYTFVSDVIKERDVVKGVITESKTGREAVTTKILIDCTGDGDAAAKAGAPFVKGRETDGKMQPMTLMFKVAGVDYDTAVFPGSFESNFDIPHGKIQDLAKQNIPHPAGHVLLYATTLPGVVTCNMTNCIDVDGTNADDLTKAHIQCRKQMDVIVDFLKKYIPGYANCYAVSSASIIGVRETRHFKGEKTITEQDILEARVFDDWAATQLSFNFDVHNISGSGLDETGCQDGFKQPKGYTVPYGCLVPLKIENLLLAGRNISGTHIAHSNFRVMPICVNLGQAAGTAAALCVKEGIPPRQLDVSKLQDVLAKSGVRV